LSVAWTPLIGDIALYGALVTLQRSNLAVIILAAGAGTRFSDAPGAKLLAPIAGRPILEHVLAAVRAFGPAESIVVLGSGADTVERSIEWAGESRVLNPEPERGIGSSIQVGFDALVTDGSIEGAFIVLGDQPRLRPAVLEVLTDHAASAAPEGSPIIVPQYADDPGPRNPVLLLRAAWPLIDDLSGDAGLGPLIAARPDLVIQVPVAGVMPDVDEPHDVAALESDGGLPG
jgi:CTP:molybdopterin cytidylyltransferase MocA